MGSGKGTFVDVWSLRVERAADAQPWFEPSDPGHVGLLSPVCEPFHAAGIGHLLQKPRLVQSLNSGRHWRGGMVSGGKIAA